MIMPGSDTHFLEVSAYASLKVAADYFFREKKNIKIQNFKLFFQSKDGGVRPKSFEMFLINIALLYLVQLHIFWK